LLYSVLVIGTYVVCCSLLYKQGLRYFLTILPFILLYVGYGVRVLLLLFKRIFSFFTLKIFNIIKHVVVIALIGFLLVENCIFASIAYQNRSVPPDNDAYSTAAVDMYRYIQSETPIDSLIAFYKPRALYLNTGRVSFKPQLSVEEEQIAVELIGPGYSDIYLSQQPHPIALSEADYILIYNDTQDKHLDFLSYVLAPHHTLQLEYSNQTLQLFKVINSFFNDQ